AVLRAKRAPYRRAARRPRGGRRADGDDASSSRRHARSRSVGQPVAADVCGEMKMAVQETERGVDQVTLQVVNNYLITTAREMGIAMRNTSYSPLFNEGLDFSCALFDEKGEMIAQAEFCPAQLGAILYVVEWTINEIGAENFAPGDVIFHNDPFRGGCHLPE